MSGVATYAVRVALIVAHAGILRMGDVEGHHPPAECIAHNQSAAHPAVCTPLQQAWDWMSKRGRHVTNQTAERVHILRGLR